jgi:hypothetical protein
VRAAGAGLVVAEVPSFEHPRIHGVSNLNAFRDGRRVLKTILAERRPELRRAPASAAAPSPARRPPGPAAHVRSDPASSPTLAASPDQRAG